MPESASDMPPPTLAVATPPPEPPNDAVLKAVLDVTKAEIDTEFKISERYEAKARNFFGIAVAFFGATQAFVLHESFRSLSHPHRHTLQVCVIVASITFGLGIIATMISTLQRSDKNFKASELLRLTREKAATLQDLVTQDIALLDSRREANTERLWRVRAAQLFCFLSVIAAAAEFTAALVYFT